MKLAGKVKQSTDGRDGSITNSITNRQMVFIIFMAITSFTTIDLPKTMAQASGRSSWIPILVAAVGFGIAAVLITKLNNLFLGKVFFDYGQEIIGKFFTYVIAIYYILYFLIIGVYLNLRGSGVMTTNFLPETPKFVFIFSALALFAFVSYKGITTIARLFEIYGMLFLDMTLMICILMISGGDKYNVLPFFNPSDMKEYAKTFKDLIIPFGGLEVLLIIPFTEKNKKAPITAFLSLLFIGLFYVLIVESTFMVLGLNNTVLLNDSFIEALKITEAPVIERLDIFYLTVGLTSLFSGSIIIFGAVTEYICRIFPKVKRLYVVLAVFIVFFSLCMAAIGIKDILKIMKDVILYPVIVSGFLIPITVFILAKIKKRGKKRLQKGSINS